MPKSKSSKRGVATVPKRLKKPQALLIAQSGKLDEAYIDDWLVQFAEALEKPEILAKYRRVVERINKL